MLCVIVGSYKKTKTGGEIVKQRFFYDNYGSAAVLDGGNDSLNKKYSFRVNESAFGKNDEIFLISQVSDNYAITYGSGRQFICVYFPERDEFTDLDNQNAVFDILTICVFMIIVCFMLLSFIICHQAG